jgi:hypothetical protein
VSLAFRVFGLPRSGTTWVANWLTTHDSICWHDPCEWATPGDVEQWARCQRRPAGICCTGLWLHRSWRPEVPTLLLDRPREEVQRSMVAKGLPELPGWALDAWDDLPFERVTLLDLLDEDNAARAHGYLLPTVVFDRQRHAELAKMKIEPSDRELSRVRSRIALTGGLK